MREINEDKYDCIHGHFRATKYKDPFPEEPIITWIREPVQRLVSLYEYWNRLPAAEPPQWFRENHPSFEEFAFSPHIRNEMSEYLDCSPLSSLSFIGITEDYNGSIFIFNRLLRERLGKTTFPPEIERRNANPARPERGYSIDPSLSKKFSNLMLKIQNFMRKRWLDTKKRWKT